MSNGQNCRGLLFQSLRKERRTGATGEASRRRKPQDAKPVESRIFSFAPDGAKEIGGFYRFLRPVRGGFPSFVIHELRWPRCGRRFTRGYAPSPLQADYNDKEFQEFRGHKY
jgi:hypothetical protein